MHISVIVPLYKCSKSIQTLTDRLKETLVKFSKEFEIIYVNDASPENDWEIVNEIALKDNRIKGISFSRNFGQHYAITAGLEFSSGEWIVVMDGDLQDLPEEIEKLYKKALEGYNIVLGRRVNRKDKFMKRISSKLFYRLFSYLTGMELDAYVANFGIYNKKVISATLSMKDYIRYFPTLVQWVGFSKASIEIEHGKRYLGESSYNFSSLFKLAINNIIGFSDKPLRITMNLGMIISILSFLSGVVYFIRYLNGSITVSGFTSLIISIWFLSGVIILLLGLVGIYIGKVFDKVKDRPNYIVDVKLNL